MISKVLDTYPSNALGVKSTTVTVIIHKMLNNCEIYQESLAKTSPRVYGQFIQRSGIIIMQRNIRDE